MVVFDEEENLSEILWFQPELSEASINHMVLETFHESPGLYFRVKICDDALIEELEKNH